MLSEEWIRSMLFNQGLDPNREMNVTMVRAIEREAYKQGQEAMLDKLAALEVENARLIQQVNAFYLSNPQGGIVTRLQATIAQQAEQLAAAERDVERYRWLRDATGETPIRPAAFNSEIMPDIRLKFDFPTLVSYNCIGVQYTLDEAIDAAIAAQKGEK